MTIPEAYRILNLDYKCDIEELRKNYFELRKNAYLIGDLETVTKIDMALKIVTECIKFKQDNKPTVAQTEEEYEFYDHMYDIPKAKISFEALLKNEIMLSNAKAQIRQMLLAMVNDIDYIFDLDTLREYADTNGLTQLIESSKKNNKTHK